MHTEAFCENLSLCSFNRSGTNLDKNQTMHILKDAETHCSSLISVRIVYQWKKSQQLFILYYFIYQLNFPFSFFRRCCFISIMAQTVTWLRGKSQVLFNVHNTERLVYCTFLHKQTEIFWHFWKKSPVSAPVSSLTLSFPLWESVQDEMLSSLWYLSNIAGCTILSYYLQINKQTVEGMTVYR